MEEHDLHLIIGYLEGNLSDAEVQELLHKVEVNPEFALALSEMADLWSKPPAKHEHGDALQALDRWKTTAPDDYQKSASEAAERTARRLNYKWYIAAAVLLGMLSFLWISQLRYLQPVSGPAFTIIKTDAHKHKTITLPDSSVVRLNASSTLKIPKDYAAETRTLHLDGEGIFEVRPNAKLPFIVRSGNVSTTALGTKFNVNAYGTDSCVTVSLLEGKVRVDMAGEYPHSVNLSPGKEVSYRLSDQTFALRDFYKEGTVGWENNTLAFHYDTWETVVKRLSRWYGIAVRLEGPGQNTQTLKGTFINLPLKETLRQIAFISGATYDIKKDTVIIKPRLEP